MSDVDVILLVVAVEPSTRHSESMGWMIYGGCREYTRETSGWTWFHGPGSRERVPNKEYTKPRQLPVTCK